MTQPEPNSKAGYHDLFGTAGAAQAPRSRATMTASAGFTAAPVCCRLTSWPVVCPSPRRCGIYPATVLKPMSDGVSAATMIVVCICLVLTS